MLRVSAWLPVAAVVALGAIVRAQAPATAPSPRSQSGFATSTTAVVVDVVVRDARGTPIVDLKPSDFELFEDDVRQRIGSVELIAPGGPRVAAPGEHDARRSAAEPPPAGPGAPSLDTPGATTPTVIAMVFHRLSADGRALAHRAARSYVESTVRPDDYAGVFTIDASLETLQPFTTDRTRLAAAIERASRTQAAIYTRNQPMSSYYGDNSPDVPPTASAESAGRPLGQSGFVPPMQRSQLPLGSSGMADKLLFELAQNMETVFEEMMRDRNGHAETAGLTSLAASMGQLPGRKSIVFFSEGLAIPAAVAAKFRAVIDTANRGNVSIYAVDTKGLKVHSEQAATARSIAALRGVGDDDPEAERDRDLRHARTNDLERNEFILSRDPAASLGLLARETGGFLVDGTNDLTASFARIDADRRFHYLLTYTPLNPSMDGAFRRIHVKVKRRGAAIRARSGYVALPMLGRVPVLRFESNALSALAASPRPTQVPLRAAAFQFPEADGTTRLALYVQTPGSGVAYFVDDKQTAWQTHFTILARVVDEGGETIRKGSQPYRMTGPAKDVHAARQGDILFYRQPTLDPGRYTIEYALYDELSGQAGTGALSVEIAARDAEAIAMSSVVLVDRAEAVPAEQRDARNPLYLQDTLIYPNLGTPIRRSSRGSLVFFYTARPGGRALTGKVDLLQGGRVIASRPLTVPPTDDSGVVRHANELPLDEVGAGACELRVSLSDGRTTVTQATPFVLQP